MQVNQSDFSDQLQLMLVSMKWASAICDACQNRFFYKETSLTPKLGRSNCGRMKCTTDTKDFRVLQDKKLPVTPEKITQSFAKFFDVHGIENCSALSIDNKSGNTDLVIAGVQMFDKVIHGGEEPGLTHVSVAQPCMRMQYKDLIKNEDGISTAFINLCTEGMELSYDQHLIDINLWISFLSSLGLHAQDMTLIERKSEKNRGLGVFTLWETYFFYGDLEIGDASYSEIPTVSGKTVIISDIGFGLERIVWAINKKSSYYSWLLPLSLNCSVEQADCVRSATLLVLNGVRASNKGPGLQLRRFCKTLAELRTGNLRELYEFYYHYWESFVTPILSLEDSWKVFTLEIDRLYNLKVSTSGSYPPPRGESREEYMRRLVYDLGLDSEKIKSIVNSL